METLRISLPSALKSFVDEQLANGNHKSPAPTLPLWFGPNASAVRKKNSWN